MVFLKKSEKNRKYDGKMIAEKLEIIRDVNKRGKNKTEILHTYGILPWLLLTYLKNQVSVEKRLQNEQKLHGAKHGDLDDKLCERFFPAPSNTIPVGGLTIQEKLNE